MRDTIYTIPITEVFEPRCGCPLCALYGALENRWVEYITGAAMMEPDIRTETNRQGFCGRHFDLMLLQRNRLAVALILQTRLDYLDQHLEKEASAGKSAGFWQRKKEPAEASCFICNKIDSEFLRITDNLLVHWEREQDFRTLYGEQEYLCLPHYRIMAVCGQNKLRAPLLAEFLTVSQSLVRHKLTALKQNIDDFCQLFDYRNAGAQRPGEHIAASIEHCVAFLTARPAAPHQDDSGNQPKA